MKKSLFIYSITALALALGACSDDQDNNKVIGCQGNIPDGKEQCICVNGQWAECKDKPCEGDGCNDPEIETAEIVRSLDSTVGCTLDADCVEGAFCFQNQCVVQCSGDKSLKLNCESGYYCDVTRGRCVTQDYLTELKKVEDQIAAAGDSMDEDEKALLRAGVELNAATMSNVRRSVLGQKNDEGNAVEKISFSSRMPLAKVIDENEKVQKVSFSTAESLGDVQYVVNLPGVELPVLKTAKGVRNDLGNYDYAFEIETAQIRKTRSHRLRSGGDIETGIGQADIVSNAGNFAVVLADRVEANGIYEGYATPLSVLSGIDLPIRMGITANPGKVGSFADIESISLLLPVSHTDIFSPENVAEDGKETWAKLAMSKKKQSECGCGKPCWAADFSTNDYAPKGSALFGGDQHVNRNIRIELFDFDAASQTFTGRIVDGLKGLYREKSIDGDNVNTTWNDTEMAGEFSVQLKYSIDDSIRVHDHKSDNESVREISEEPPAVCNDSQVASLMARIDLLKDGNDAFIENCDNIENDEDKKQECLNIRMCRNVKGMADFNGLTADLQLICLKKAADDIADDEGSMSKVLGAVLKADASSSESTKPVAVVCDGKKEIHNFDDFQAACDDTTCSLCADHPEYVCAADLLARRYLKNDLDIDTQTDLMKAWTDVIRESYLAHQYMAWNEDNTIRKAWLTGAVYQGTFAASIMNDFNEDLLLKYREKVLDIQHGIMDRQFSQTTLEMLTQTMVQSTPKTLELNSARNTILSELASTWESVGSSLGLSSRRYDVLLQDDAKRIRTASELRPYLFDLYFAGVLESAINLKADQGSLNASYGANLSSIISKIESLDQTFESLVFMRDGEIVTDTSLDTGSGLTALGKAKEAAQNSVEKAIAKRKTVFDEMAAKRKEKLTVKDNYLSSLGAMRTEIVNLCGYPSDCTSDKQASCKIFTTPYFCGLRSNRPRPRASASTKNRTTTPFPR